MSTQRMPSKIGHLFSYIYVVVHKNLLIENELQLLADSMQVGFRKWVRQYGAIAEYLVHTRA